MHQQQLTSHQGQGDFVVLQAGVRELIGLGPACSKLVLRINILAYREDLLRGKQPFLTCDCVCPDHIDTAVFIQRHAEVRHLIGLQLRLANGVNQDRRHRVGGAVGLQLEAAVGVDAVIQQIGNVDVTHTLSAAIPEELGAHHTLAVNLLLGADELRQRVCQHVLGQADLIVGVVVPEGVDLQEHLFVGLGVVAGIAVHRVSVDCHSVVADGCEIRDRIVFPSTVGGFKGRRVQEALTAEVVDQELLIGCDIFRCFAVDFVVVEFVGHPLILGPVVRQVADDGVVHIGICQLAHILGGGAGLDVVDDGVA